MAGKPRPLELQRESARGDGVTPGGRKIKSTELTYYDPAQLPAVPEGLGERGELEWCKIWDAGRWLHPVEDYHWVEQIAFAYDDLETFRAAVKEQGLIARGYAGQVVANPLIKEMRACEATIRKCLSMLGFSPTDRARLGLAEIKRQSSLADLQGRTKGNRS